MFDTFSDVTLGASSNLFSPYADLILKICQIVNSAGFPLTPFRAGAGSVFAQLPSAQQKGIVDGLEKFLDLCESARKDGVSFRENSAHAGAWYVIRRLGMRPLSDFFTHVEKNDIIEIYDQNNVQMFRSFNMFRCISYSLDELVTFEWSQLYDRPADIHERILGATLKARSERRTVTDLLGEKHVIGERFSVRRRKAIYEARVVSPLLSASGNEVAGYINLIRATPIEN